jgi:prepilin-type N-terminal cleavage/methylation domain-containing protein
MKLCTEKLVRERGAVSRHASARGFTLMEVVLVLALMVMLITATLGAILGMQVSSTRVSDYTSAMAVLEAKAMDIRAVYYNPPNYPFTAGTVYVTNQNSIALNQAGTTFQVPGTVVSKIEYQGKLGSLVTVTATFQTSRTPMTLSLQTFVNKYSGGQQ